MRNLLPLLWIVYVWAVTAALWIFVESTMQPIANVLKLTEGN